MQKTFSDLEYTGKKTNSPRSLHLLEPTHNERFISILEEHYPTWREAPEAPEARAELSELPLTAEAWKE